MSRAETQGAIVRFVSPEHKEPNDNHFNLDIIFEGAMAYKRDDKGRRAKLYFVAWEYSTSDAIVCKTRKASLKK